MKALITAALILPCLCSTSLKAQDMTSTWERVEQAVKDYASKEHGGGIAVAVLYPNAIDKNNYERKTFFFGHIKADESPPPREDTIFYLASVSKVFLATVLAKFIKEGKMDLDDPVQKYMPPEVHVPSYEGKPITIRDLATHTSSLPRNIPDVKHPNRYQLKDFYEFLNHYKLKEPPGTKYLYSNLGFGFLGLILSNVAHMPLQETIVQEMCDPLNMPDTRIYYSPEQEERKPYFYLHGHRVFKSTISALPVFGRGGAFASTLEDMTQFLAFNLGFLDTGMNDILPIIFQHAYTISPGEYMCLGWHDGPLYPRSSIRILAKNGGLPGVSAFIGFIPGSKTGVVCLSNDQVPTTPLGIAILKILNPKESD